MARSSQRVGACERRFLELAYYAVAAKERLGKGGGGGGGGGLAAALAGGAGRRRVCRRGGGLQDFLLEPIFSSKSLIGLRPSTLSQQALKSNKYR
jgi:hypothetical protein